MAKDTLKVSGVTFCTASLATPPSQSSPSTTKRFCASLANVDESDVLVA